MATDRNAKAHLAVLYAVTAKVHLIQRDLFRIIKAAKKTVKARSRPDNLSKSPEILKDIFFYVFDTGSIVGHHTLDGKKGCILHQ